HSLAGSAGPGVLAACERGRRRRGRDASRKRRWPGPHRPSGGCASARRLPPPPGESAQPWTARRRMAWEDLHFPIAPGLPEAIGKNSSKAAFEDRETGLPLKILLVEAEQMASVRRDLRRQRLDFAVAQLVGGIAHQIEGERVGVGRIGGHETKQSVEAL